MWTTYGVNNLNASKQTVGSAGNMSAALCFGGDGFKNTEKWFGADLIPAQIVT